MANFYNPYSKYPDFAGGASDIMNQIMMMLMIKQMMGKNQQQQPQLPASGGVGVGAGAGMQGAMGNAPQGVGSPFGTPYQQNPQLMTMLIQMMKGRQYNDESR